MTTTSSSTFGGLGLPEPVDNMDISSPYNRNADDFDIDIDLPPNASNLPNQDDVILVEDPQHDVDVDLDLESAQDVNKDDVMVDEERQSVLSEDKTMRDDNTTLDEHLTDASDNGMEELETANEEVVPDGEDVEITAIRDEGYQDYTKAPNIENSVLEPPRSNIDESIKDNYDTSISHKTPEVLEPNNLDQKKAADKRSELEDITETQASHVNIEEAREIIAPDIPQPKDNGEDQLDNSYEEDNRLENEKAEYTCFVNKTETANNEDEHSNAAPIAEREDLHEKTNSPNANIPGSPITPLHHVIVHYDGNDISLFPPSEGESSETFLLVDENLVNVSMTDMLRACRSVLGDSIREEDELELIIEDLGISLSESCIQAASTSFNDILNLYLTLKELDEVDAEPLNVTLLSRSNFSVRFQALQSAASEGKGLSQVTFLSESQDVEDDFGETNTLNENEQELHPEDEENETLDDENHINQAEESSDPNQVSQHGVTEAEPPPEKVTSKTSHSSGKNGSVTDNKNGEETAENEVNYNEGASIPEEDDDDLQIYDDEDDPEKNPAEVPNAAEPNSTFSGVEEEQNDALATDTNTNTNDEIDLDAQDTERYRVNGEETPEDDFDLERAEIEGASEEDSVTNDDQNDNWLPDEVDDLKDPSETLPTPDNNERDNAPTFTDEINLSNDPHAQNLSPDNSNIGQNENNAAVDQEETDKPLHSASKEVLKSDPDQISYEGQPADEYDELVGQTDSAHETRPKDHGEAAASEIETLEHFTTHVEGEDIDRDNDSAEKGAEPKTASPSTKRVRNDDLNDGSEGEGSSTDNKRIRSL